MAQGRMTLENQQRFRYLFERMSEPLGMGMKGPSGNMVFYNVPTNETWSPSAKLPLGKAKQIEVKMPVNMPMTKLRMISSMCPRMGLFGYFIPEHRKALFELKKIFMAEKTTEDFFSMACACRDSQMINSHLFVCALSSCMNSRRDMKNFDMPALYEVMPDIFLPDHVIKMAGKMAQMTENESDKKIILVNEDRTGNQKDPENRMAYFREDIGINSHHFHWHIVFPGNYTGEEARQQKRRGELFYYMHHSMVARYEAERLCNGLSRTKVFDFDNLMIEEGYFGKLYSITAARQWGTRQANTKLQPILRRDEILIMDWDLKIEDLKKWRDRILEAIDTGYIIRKDKDEGNQRSEKLEEDTGIDILGDMIENSQDTPHDQFYGIFGFHNMGHLLIAFSNDPSGKHIENFGPMGDTATAMRDPAFYRWHKYIDQLFDQYKKTLEPYKLIEVKDDKKKSQKMQDTWPLIWQNIVVGSISVRKPNSDVNILSTHWMQTDIDLARGLDFRRSKDTDGPIWARVKHLNYDAFEYHIQVHNDSPRQVKATVRIFMAPRLDEHGRNLSFNQQRLLFFELDKFSQTLAPKMNNIVKKSTESSITIKMQNSFLLLEKTDREESIKRKDMLILEEGRCGCGWPQHMLLPKGTISGMKFDLFVIITDGEKDTVPPQQGGNSCREAMSFCGVLDEDYPDKRPMGYPFDRAPFTHDVKGRELEVPVRDLADYVKHIPNAGATQIEIRHEDFIKVNTSEGAPPNMRMVNEMGEIVHQPGGQGPAQVNVPPGGNFSRKNERQPPPSTLPKTRPPPIQPGRNDQWNRPQTGQVYDRNGQGFNRSVPEDYNRSGRQDDPVDDWDVLDNYDDMQVDSPGSRY